MGISGAERDSCRPSGSYHGDNGAIWQVGPPPPGFALC